MVLFQQRQRGSGLLRVAIQVQGPQAQISKGLTIENTGEEVVVCHRLCGAEAVWFLGGIHYIFHGFRERLFSMSELSKWV